jgi:hypothetical protein
MNTLHSKLYTINKLILKKFNNISLISKKISETSNPVISQQLNKNRDIKYADKFYVNIRYIIYFRRATSKFPKQLHLLLSQTILNLCHLVYITLITY